MGLAACNRKCPDNNGLNKGSLNVGSLGFCRASKPPKPLLVFHSAISTVWPASLEFKMKAETPAITFMPHIRERRKEEIYSSSFWGNLLEEHDPWRFYLLAEPFHTVIYTCKRG